MSRMRRGTLYIGTVGNFVEVTRDRYPRARYATGDKLEDWFEITMDHDGALVVRGGSQLSVEPDVSNLVRLRMRS